ncbi:hypothetical protein ACFQY8_03175 [Alloscardovia venturai]|uniref:MBL fold metallo-hydrolase n=1 Tax=Alloscardovia venturai TaxID=1769421 RepID=A0ABW2Y3Y2_9BIFI
MSKRVISIISICEKNIFVVTMRSFLIIKPTRYVHPFRILGDVWFVGDSWVSVHLIDTGNGLLLTDAGNVGATAQLIQSIWEAGFNPADVK